MEWTPIVDCVYDATITVPTISGDIFAVTIQLKDFAGNDLTVPSSILAYVSDDSAGKSIMTLSTDIHITSSGDGDIAVLTTNEVYLLVSEADGDIAIDVETTGAHNYYLVLVMPNGKLEVSGVLAFT